MMMVVLQNTPTLNNFTLYPMLYEGTDDKPYEQYGTMPSPDFPSEIKTVKDSVEAKVVNKNILPFDIKTAEWDEAKISIANNDLTITPNSNGACASVLNGNSLDLSVKQ